MGDYWEADGCEPTEVRDDEICECECTGQDCPERKDIICGCIALMICVAVLVLIFLPSFPTSASPSPSSSLR